MSSQALRSSVRTPRGHGLEPLRVAFMGFSSWVQACSPSSPTQALSPHWVEVGDPGQLERALADAAENEPHVTVVFDPGGLPPEFLAELPGATLGVVVGRLPTGEAGRALDALDRVATFLPSLTGTKIGRGRIWRAMPPPVSDQLFGEVRPLHARPRAMTVGRSTPYREEMLVPAKHHHDVLQVIHGVSGPPLVEFLREHDVGVYFPRDAGGGFGQQVGMHLAAGHLLVTEELVPPHGLERNIDYLQVESPTELVWVLDRLTRFPEMYQRIRHRGRLKAEQYRASRLFGRVAPDLLADVAAFGSERAGT